MNVSLIFVFSGDFGLFAWSSRGCRIYTASGQSSSAISDVTSPVLKGKQPTFDSQSHPFNTDSEGAIESVRINRGFLLRRLNLEKI